MHCTATYKKCNYALPAAAVDRYNMITGEHMEFMPMRNDMFQVGAAVS